MSEIVLIGNGVQAGSSSKNLYDLTPVMAAYFDLHMVNPLLDHLLEVLTSFLLISSKCDRIPQLQH